MVPQKMKKTKLKLKSPKANLFLSQDVPEVIVDFIFEEGLFFVSVENISDRPALKVQVEFDPKFNGGGGSLGVSEQALFQNIEFLAPRKRIVTFLDTSSSYFGRGEPTRITAKIHFQDSQGKEYSNTVRHDLEIYKTLGMVQRREN